jgi:hypothetical protein
MVYESMVYISQYLPKLEAQAMHVVDFIWDVNSIKNGSSCWGKVQ